MLLLKDKHIIVGITGGISAYKALTLIRLLKKAGASVKPCPTNNALKFIMPLSLQALTGESCLLSGLDSQTSQLNHISQAQKADLVVVAPATANFLAKLSLGLADEALLQTILSFNGPLLLAPAMETNMWQNAATQYNMSLLKKRGINFVGPAQGELASGDTGYGRMSEPSQIFDHICSNLAKKDFLNKKVLVTAGPTIEDFDPVRFLSNRSSGKMGVALACALAFRGAAVELVHGPLNTCLPGLPNLKTHEIRSANQMFDKVLSLANTADMVFMCAAVCDFTPQNQSPHKLKKSDQSLSNITLVKTPDILSQIGSQPNKLLLVGFAAETDNLIENAIQKCVSKNCDFICVNDIGQTNCGFNTETNQITLVNKNGVVKQLEHMSKFDTANKILDQILLVVF